MENKNRHKDDVTFATHRNTKPHLELHRGYPVWVANYTYMSNYTSENSHTANGKNFTVDEYIIMTNENLMVRPIPDKIYYNLKKRVTTVLWKDGTKTIVTCAEGEPFDKEKGFLAALGRKIYSHYKNYIRYVNRAVTYGEEDITIHVKTRKQK